MKTIMLMTNFDRENALACTREVCRYLAGIGIEVLMSKEAARWQCEGVRYGEFYRMLEEAEAVLAVGGDGTILHAAKHAVAYRKPVFGINAGRLGFLAGLEPEGIGRLERLRTGEYQIRRRMMLEVAHRRENRETAYLALNDVVISKGAVSRVVDLDIFCMDRFVTSYRADGVILATPTGSTAYSLSAGGPIVDPEMDCVILTPISPHSLFDRTIVFDAHNRLTIRPGADGDTEIYLTVDGEKAIRVQPGDEITVRRSETEAELIDLTGKPFYEVLQEKFLTRAKS